ncbi:MAG: hypothetical protein NC320_04625 [Clostridium sp.]|nr:hypothetical protein [Clostridium sp.]
MKVTTSDYLRFIISDKMPFEIYDNDIIRFLRGNLILEIIEFFIMAPVLRTEPDYKKIELIYHGSYYRYIWNYVKKIIPRTICILIWNMISIMLCQRIFDINIRFSHGLHIFLYAVMLGFLLMIISFITIICSIYKKRYWLTGICIAAIFLIMLVDMNLKSISLVYYNDSPKIVLTFAVYFIICSIFLIAIILKGRKR